MLEVQLREMAETVPFPEGDDEIRKLQGDERYHYRNWRGLWPTLAYYALVRAQDKQRSTDPEKIASQLLELVDRGVKVADLLIQQGFTKHVVRAGLFAPLVSKLKPAAHMIGFCLSRKTARILERFQINTTGITAETRLKMIKLMLESTPEELKRDVVTVFCAWEIVETHKHMIRLQQSPRSKAVREEATDVLEALGGFADLFQREANRKIFEQYRDARNALEKVLTGHESVASTP